MLRTSTLLAALIAAAATVAVPAAAAPPAAVRTVAYADLDLSAAAGQARLAQRIRAAVRAVCGTAFATDLRARAEVRDCREETLASLRGPAGRVEVNEIAGTR